MRGVLISIDAWDRAALARVTVRVGAGLNAATLGADGLQWEPALLRRPRLTQQLLDDDLTGALMVGQGEFILSANLLRNLDANQVDWVGAPVRIYTGDGSRLSDLTREFVGRITGGVADARTGQIPVQIEVDKAIVDVPLLTRTYGGGGGADGDPEIRGTFMPAGYGRPINVKPVLIDQVNDVYQWDAYGNSTGCAGVYENLASFGAPLADYAGYAALVAAKNAGSIPEGRWATAIAEGMFCLGAPATGTITCDPICGAGTPGEMMLRWLRTHAGVVEARLRAADFAALTAAVQAAVGAVPAVNFWTVDEGNVLDLMQRMCASCNAVPLFMLDGTITVTRITDGSAAALTLDRQGGTPPVVDWASLDPTLPWWRLRMTAARTYNIHTPADIDYEDDIKDRGDYVPGETYRQGHVVRWTDGARYLFVNATPAAGTPPPTAGYWELYEDAPDATQIRYPSGYTLADLEPAEKGATVGMTTAEEQAFALAQASIAVILSDNVVAAGQEKAELKRRFDQAKAGYDGAHGTSVGFIPLYGDVTYTARVNADAALSAVTDYLAAVRPAWDDQTVDTPVDGLQLTIRFANLWDKIAKLNQANDAFIRDRARQAQQDIDAIASDAVLSRGSEKAKAIQERDAQEDDYAALVARYVALGSPADIQPAADQAAAAITARRQYLAGLVPAWNDVSVDTPIVQSVWRQMWGNAYAAISTFRAAITGRKGDKGDKGDSAYAIINSNEAHTVAADKDGNVYDYGDARFTITIFYGTTDVTSSFALDGTLNPQGLAGVAAYPTYSVTSGFDAGEATASVTYNFVGKPNTPHAGVPLSTVFSLSKSRDGATGPGGGAGAAAPLVKVTADPQAIPYNALDQISSGDVVFTAQLTNTPGPVGWSSAEGHGIYSTPGVSFSGNTMRWTAQRMADVLAYNIANLGKRTATIIASSSGTSDSVTVTKIKDGDKGNPGNPGDPGLPGTDGFIVDTDTNNWIIPVFPSGAPKPSWQGGGGTIMLRKGKGIITAGVTYSLEGATNMAGLGISGANYSFSGIAADTGYFTIVATLDGVAYRGRVDVKKVYDGSPAFKGGVTVGGNRGTSFSATGQTPIGGGSTVRISLNFDYSAPDPKGSEAVFRGRAMLFYRNQTDNGDNTLAGSADGTNAITTNTGTEAEPVYSRTPGTVSAAFTFTSAAADKIYEFSVQITNIAGDTSVVVLGQGNLRLEVTG